MHKDGGGGVAMRAARHLAVRTAILTTTNVHGTRGNIKSED